MSKCNKIRILNETINAKDKSTLITTPKELTNNRERAIVFSFSNFQKESIKCRDFNNYYRSKLDAINAARDFMESIKNLSTYTPSQLFEPALKEQYHYNEFKDELHIQRIENVLINGYNMKSEKVKQFEKLYFEFQFSDGKRVIGIKIEENKFSLLFLDSSHFICKESSRNIKQKEKYSIPGVFGGWEESVDNILEVSKDDFLQMIIDDIQMGKCTDIHEMAKDLEDIVSM